MSDYPPPPNQPPAGGPPPPEPPPGQGGQYGGAAQPGSYNQYGGAPQQPGGYGAPPPAPGGTRPGELLDRFLARLIDGALYLVVSLILGVILGAILISSSADLDGDSRVAYNIVSSIIGTAIVLGYFALMESSRGQTVGKIVMKLKVVTPSGGNPTFVQAAKRNIWLAIGLLGILGFIGSLLSFFGSIAAIVVIVIGINSLPDRRTWFDKLGGDLQVVKLNG